MGGGSNHVGEGWPYSTSKDSRLSGAVDSIEKRAEKDRLRYAQEFDKFIGGHTQAPPATMTKVGHSVEEVQKFRGRLFEKSMALIAKKGADYNRDQQNSGDTLFNLRVCELLGIVPSSEEGILVRLSDKFMRLISLTKPGREAAVCDESVLDTIADIHNYIDYLGLMWQQRKQNAVIDQANARNQRNQVISEEVWKDLGRPEDSNANTCCAKNPERVR